MCQAKTPDRNTRQDTMWRHLAWRHKAEIPGMGTKQGGTRQQYATGRDTRQGGTRWGQQEETTDEDTRKGSTRDMAGAQGKTPCGVTRGVTGHNPNGYFQRSQATGTHEQKVKAKPWL